MPSPDISERIPNQTVSPPITASKGVLEKLARLGIHTERDLLLHLPIRYEDETHLYPIKGAPENQLVQIEGEIIHSEVTFRPRRQLVCQVKDASGILFIRFLNFYGSQVKAYATGARVRLLGTIHQGYYGIEMVHPKCQIVRQNQPLADTLTPVYSTTAGLAQKTIRKLIDQVFTTHPHTSLTETLPQEIIDQYQLADLQTSIHTLHYPPPDISLESLQNRTHPAWHRIKFDELLAQQLSMRMHYQQRKQHDAPKLTPKNKLTQALIKKLTFKLTQAQENSYTEISHDLAKPHPMHRLLQGDVGSGKTIVATLAALQAIENNYQVAIMAPTEILTKQHYQKISTWLAPLGIQVAWLSGSQKKKQKQAALTDIADGTAMLAIGTHALFQEHVAFKQLGLAIIDEQHRFGVHQRLSLRLKGSNTNQAPHQLMMSATPIPRTLSMSYFADLDVSVIDELPPGRTPVITKLIADNRRDDITNRIQHECQQGKQVYWVCPLIEESETLQLKTAQDTFDNLNQIFPELKIGLVHGRLPSQEKSEIMQVFQQGNIQLLVATTVIEVGVDVPNASLMVIEHAERMGLSQLHQLRGRIGRGTDTGICILMYKNPLSKIARQRLKIIYEHTDGFEIARQDLNIRGPGEFMGARQSGIPMLRFADLEKDEILVEAAQNAAENMLTRHPQCAQHHIQYWLGNQSEYLRV